MFTTARFARASLLLAALGSTACWGANGPEDGEEVAAAQQALEAENSLTSNSLTSNSLTSNSLTSNSLTSNSLTSNSLTSNSLTYTALTTDPMARELLKYVVSCALESGETIDIDLGGAHYTYAGQLGLAPNWGKANGSCNATCRAWVSGCVLARVNHDGVSVPISLRGRLQALDLAPTEALDYPNAEATYYGDIFASPQLRFACTAPGSTLISRVCGPSTVGCVMNVVGDCPDFCVTRASDGSYANCRDAQHSVYQGAISVYRQ